MVMGLWALVIRVWLSSWMSMGVWVWVRSWVSTITIVNANSRNRGVAQSSNNK